jgi:hypothetical protein
VSDRKAIERRLASYRQRVRRAAAKADLRSAIDRKSLDLAGEFFNLDPKDPAMHYALLYILADVLFGFRNKGRPKGSNKVWDFDRYFTLYRLYQLEKRNHPKLRNAKIAELICERKEFKNKDPEQVRQHIPRALREHAEYERRCREMWRYGKFRLSSSV